MEIFSCGERSFMYTVSMNYDTQKIMRFYREKKRMPSYAELADLYGFKSKNAAFKLAEKFINEGFFEKDSQGKLIPGKKLFSIRMLGYVQAGFPSLGEETVNDNLLLDDWLLGDRDASYILCVNGDSMIDAGIHEGDYVIVERTLNANVGDIVIAEINDEWTMKYLRKDSRGNFYLEAANDEFSDIYPDGPLQIHAVVKSLVRRYEV